MRDRFSRLIVAGCTVRLLHVEDSLVRGLPPEDRFAIRRAVIDGSLMKVEQLLPGWQIELEFIDQHSNAHWILVDARDVSVI